MRPIRTTSAYLSISGVLTETIGLPIARYSRSLIGLALMTCRVSRYGMIAASNRLP